MHRQSGARVFALGSVVAQAVAVVAPARAGSPMSTSPEQVYDLGEIPSARAVGMGGALNSLGVSTTSLYLNPANMPLARVYHIESLSAYVPEANRQTYGLAIVDSVLNGGRLAGGLGGTWSQMDPNATNRTWTDVRAALALPPFMSWRPPAPGALQASFRSPDVIVESVPHPSGNG